MPTQASLAFITRCGRGLEHGFTIAAPPAGEDGALVLRLAVRGTLRPRAHDDGRGLDFLDADGATLLDYTGLVVADADGRALPARLATDDQGVRLVVDDAGARYPIVIDPVASMVAQQAYLKASNTGAGDWFGYSVAVSGDTAVVGALYENSSAVGIDGDGSNNSAIRAGAAYVFTGLGLPEETVITATAPRQTLTADAALPTRFVYIARAQAGGLIDGFTPGTDRVDLAAVLTEQRYAGTDPIADGTLRLLDRRGRCYLLVDPDGSAGPQRAFTLTALEGVACSALDTATDLVTGD